ncbi:hypothetical protein ACFTAO_33630 [Paenibacillus rhizoplanae]
MMADRQLQAWAEWISGERLGIIIGFRFQPVKDDSDTMLELARDCHRWIMDNLRVSLTFGVGPVVRGWREIKNSYAAAAEGTESQAGPGNRYCGSPYGGREGRFRTTEL